MKASHRCFDCVLTVRYTKGTFIYPDHTAHERYDEHVQFDQGLRIPYTQSLDLADYNTT